MRPNPLFSIKNFMLIRDREIPLKAIISEGKKAFTKRKFTAEEIAQLELFLPYFEVEKLEKDSKLKSKL